MVLGLQGYLVLTTFSAEASLGMMVALLLRELGPVVTALLFAGRRLCTDRRNRFNESNRADIQFRNDGCRPS